MFGLSLKEKLTKLILNCSKEMLPLFKENVKKALFQASLEEFETIYPAILCDYLDSVANSVFADIKNISITVSTRFNLILNSPSITGYNIDPDGVIWAGGVLSWSYYAITGKQISPKEGIVLNHAQAELIKNVMNELNDELTYNLSNVPL